MGRRLISRFVIVAGLLLFTLIAGTVGFRVLENYPPFDAFYMTLITVTTVGYQELHPLSRQGRIFNSVLILFGVSAIFLAIGAVTQTVIELEFREQFGKRRKKHMIEELKNHVIVCGFGRVGRSASLQLQRERVPFLVMDRSRERVERATHLNMLAMHADSTRDEDLKEAGVMRAGGLIAALSSDADNVFVILSAKGLNPHLTVVTRASEEEAENKLRSAGADTVFAPYRITGHRLTQALLRPHVAQFLDFATTNIDLNVVIEQVRVEPGAEFVAKTLGEMQIRRELGVMVLGIRKPDGRMLFNPPGDTPIYAGDFLIVIGEQSNLRDLEHRLAGSRER
jgi:voltage-gated potassium channel